MIYLVYMIFIIFYITLIFPKFPKHIYEKLRVDKTYIAGLFASLGISAFANKIDYIIYWNVENLTKYWFSITFAIIMILVSLWLFDTKKKDK